MAINSLSRKNILYLAALAGLAFFFLLGAQPAHAAIAFVQAVQNLDTSGLSTTTVAVQITATGGNFLAVACHVNAGAAISSVTDNASPANTYALVSTSTNQTRMGGLFYAANITGGTFTPQCNFSSVSGAAVGIVVLEFSGVATSAVTDGSATSTSVGNALSLLSGNITTTNANDLLIYAVGDEKDEGTTWSSSSGTIPASATNNRQGVSYRIVSSSSTYNDTISVVTNSAGMDGVFGAFKAAPPPGICGASSNISTTTPNYWAWNDAIGWMDFCNTQTVVVSSTIIQGYASSSVGDVSLDCATTRNGNICPTSNYSVTNDSLGNLAGFAWNDTYGWISFCGGQSTTNCPGTISYRVTIDSAGDFHNYAWNDTIGWISFNCANTATCGTSSYKVNTSWRSVSTSGYVDSTTYDTGVIAGAQLNSVIWQGSKPAGTSVGFQFATSNASSGPWTFYGPGGSASAYFTDDPGKSISIDYNLFNNFRYFRYRATLFSNAAQTASPQVDEIIVNWSP